MHGVTGDIKVSFLVKEVSSFSSAFRSKRSMISCNRITAHRVSFRNMVWRGQGGKGGSKTNLPEKMEGEDMPSNLNILINTAIHSDCVIVLSHKSAMPPRGVKLINFQVKGVQMHRPQPPSPPPPKRNLTSCAT